MRRESIEYNLSGFDRLVRSILGFLKRNLNEGFYNLLYDFLRSIKQGVHRIAYLVRIPLDYMSGNKENLTRRYLTWRLLRYSMGGGKSLENAHELTLSVEKNQINGDLVECGVARGGASAMMAMTSRKFGTIKRCSWLFDSFEGLPEPGEKDYKDGETGLSITPLGKGECLGTIEEVRSLFIEKLEFDPDQIKFVKGWFENTLPVEKNNMDSIAILRLDGDWYESTMVPLVNLYPLVSSGGYVIIDDYATCFGSKKAVDEYLELNNIETTLKSDDRGGAWFVKP